MDGIKVTFFGNTESKQPPDLERICLINSIYIADRKSIGVMKLDVLPYRRAFRDYYDIYSLLREGLSLEEMIDKTKVFSRHRLRTRDILLTLANGKYFDKDAGFDRLMPKHDVSADDIELFMIERIREMKNRDMEPPHATTDKLATVLNEIRLRESKKQQGSIHKPKH